MIHLPVGFKHDSDRFDTVRCFNLIKSRCFRLRTLNGMRQSEWTRRSCSREKLAWVLQAPAQVVPLWVAKAWGGPPVVKGTRHEEGPARRLSKGARARPHTIFASMTDDQFSKVVPRDSASCSTHDPTCPRSAEGSRMIQEVGPRVMGRAQSSQGVRVQCSKLRLRRKCDPTCPEHTQGLLSPAVQSCSAQRRGPNATIKENRSRFDV